MKRNYLESVRAYGLEIKVRELREQRRMTQEALATLIHIAPTRLSEKETGAAPWKLLDLLKIAAAFRVPFWDLVEVKWPIYLRPPAPDALIAATPGPHEAHMSPGALAKANLTTAEDVLPRLKLGGSKEA